MAKKKKTKKVVEKKPDIYYLSNLQLRRHLKNDNEELAMAFELLAKRIARKFPSQMQEELARVAVERMYRYRDTARLNANLFAYFTQIAMNAMRTWWVKERRHLHHQLPNNLKDNSHKRR